MALHFLNGELRVFDLVFRVVSKSREFLNMPTLIVDQIPVGLVIRELTNPFYPHERGFQGKAD